MSEHTRLEKSDKWIVGITSICAILLLSWLVHDILYNNPLLEGQNKIGEIFQVKNRVKRKFSRSLLWYPAAQDEIVYENDWIFTGNDSVAKIRLDSGDEIVIEPDSLIILSRKNGVLQLDLQHGQLLANVKSKDVKINVTRNGKKQTIDTSKGSVKVAKKVAQEAEPVVDLLDLDQDNDGQEDVTLSQLSDRQNFTPKEGFTALQENGLSVKQVTVKKAKLYEGQKTTLDLEWEDPFERWSLYSVEISDDPDFETVLASGEVNKSPFSFVHGNSGNYFWRVKGSNSKGLQSPWSNKAIANLDIQFLEKSQPLRLSRNSYLYQMDQKDFENVLPDRSFNTKEKPIKISWEEHDKATSYKVQVSDQENFENIREEKIIKDTQWDLTNLKLGKTFFRVVPETKEGIALAQPATGKVTTYFPTPKSQSLKTKPQGDKKQLLTWEPVPYAEAYQVTYQTERDGKPKRRIVKDNQVKISNNSGFLKWKVRVVDPETKKSMSSNSESVDWYQKAKKLASVSTEEVGQAVRAVPVITSPAPRKTFISLNRSPLFIVMNWNYEEEAKAFEVEISKNAEMSDLVYKKRVRNKNRAVINQVFDPGIYFLRVRASNGNVLDEAWSETEVFRVINRKAN